MKTNQAKAPTKVKKVRGGGFSLSFLPQFLSREKKWNYEKAKQLIRKSRKLHKDGIIGKMGIDSLTKDTELKLTRIEILKRLRELDKARIQGFGLKEYFIQGCPCSVEAPVFSPIKKNTKKSA